MTQSIAIGLMSGTSGDGVDVALVETDGEEIARLGPIGYRAYTDGERDLLREAIAAAADITDRAARPQPLADAEEAITAAHAEAVEAFLLANGIARSTVAAVGFHGQTVRHEPQRRLTVQLGHGVALARRLGMRVVYDFRAADVAAGGEGAPLVPVFHRAMARRLTWKHPIGILNLGGVANVTFLDGDLIVAGDTGPGNALIDDLMRERTGAAQDLFGRAAAAGRVDTAAVARVLDHPFFARRPPKSLDRDELRQWVNQQGRIASLGTEDAAATLTAITAASIARAVDVLPRVPGHWIAGGGGTRNATLMRMLSEQLAPASVESADAVGWSADALEAQAFAYLAMRCLRDLPITFPSTTGVPRPLTGGVVAEP